MLSYILVLKKNYLLKDPLILKDKELGHKGALGQSGLGEEGPAGTREDVNQRGNC